MPSLSELRSRLPVLNGLSDPDALTYIQRAYYPGRTVDEIGMALGIEPPAPPGPKAGLMRTAGDMALKAGQGVVGLGESVVGLADLATGGAAGRGLAEVGYDPARAKSIIGEGLSDAQQASDRAVQRADGFVDTLAAAVQNPRSIAGAVAESAPSILGSGAVSSLVAKRIFQRAALAAGGLETAAGQAAGRAAVEAAGGRLMWAGSGAEGALTAGQIAEQARQENPDDPSAMYYGIPAGIATALIGRGAGKLMGDAETAIFTGAKSAGVSGSLPARIAKSAFSEGVLEEAPQSAQEQAFTNLATNKPVGQGVGQAAAMGLVTGGAMGGGMAVLQGKSREEQGAEATQRLATATNVSDMIAAATDLASVPLDVQAAPSPAAQTPDAPAPLDRFSFETREGAAAFLDGQNTNLEPAQKADGTWSFIERPAGADGSATISEQTVDQRKEALFSTLRDRSNLQQIRDKLGDKAVSTIAYYSSQANRTDIPPATAERMLELAEMVVSRALAQPIAGQQQPAAPAPQDAIGMSQQDLLTMNQPPAQIGLDTAPTGTLRADAAGNVAPETRADQINTNQAAADAQQAQLDQQALGTQARKASAVNGEPNPRRPAPPLNMPTRTRSDGVPLDNLPAAEQADPVLNYVDAQRQVNTPQARAFVQDFKAGRITRRDVIRVMQSQGQDPLTADERIANAAAQAPAPASDLINTSPVFKSRSGAFVEARKTGGTVEPVQGGFVVKGGTNDQRDMAAAAQVATRPGDAGRDQSGRGVGDLGSLLADGGRRVQPAAEASAPGRAAPAPAREGDQRDDALTVVAKKPLAATQRKGRKPVIDPERDTLLQALAKAGGLNRDEVAREFGLAPEEQRATVKAGNLKAFPFRKTGMSIDRAIEMLQQEGYFDGIEPDELRKMLETAIFDELGGSGRLSTRGQMRAAQMQSEERDAQEQADLQDEITAEEAAERAAIMADAGLDESGIAALNDEVPLEALSGDEASLMRALGYTEQEIADELGNQETDRGTSQGEAARVAQELAGEVRSLDGARSQEAQDPGAREGLTIPAGGSVTPRAADPITNLGRVMQTAGWEIDYVDLDLTGEKPRAEIKIHRGDGRWLWAKLDAQGRASFETFQREGGLGRQRGLKAGARAPLVPKADDIFLGRRKFEGARAMLRDMTNYLVDNATNPVALEDMRAAWAPLLSSSVTIGAETPLIESQSPADLRAKTDREAKAKAADAAEQKRLADKAKADAQRDEFTLTGSDSPADLAAAAGQAGLFDAAQPESPSVDAPALARAGGDRPDKLIALRKRESILKSLKECLA